MTEAIAMARRGVELGHGGPFGAVVVKDGRVVGRGWNQVTASTDPTAHAEINAIRDAAKRLGSVHLDGCELYASCEPCPMCLGASYWAHIARIYYAASEQDAAELGFDDRFIRRELQGPTSGRTLPMAQVMREEALAVFAQWRDSDLKQAY